jgi:hypothetical protein
MQITTTTNGISGQVATQPICENGLCSIDADFAHKLRAGATVSEKAENGSQRIHYADDSTTSQIMLRPVVDNGRSDYAAN